MITKTKTLLFIVFNISNFLEAAVWKINPASYEEDFMESDKSKVKDILISFRTLLQDENILSDYSEAAILLHAKIIDFQPLLEITTSWKEVTFKQWRVKISSSKYARKKLLKMIVDELTSFHFIQWDVHDDQILSTNISKTDGKMLKALLKTLKKQLTKYKYIATDEAALRGSLSLELVFENDSPYLFLEASHNGIILHQWTFPLDSSSNETKIWLSSFRERLDQLLPAQLNPILSSWQLESLKSSSNQEFLDNVLKHQKTAQLGELQASWSNLQTKLSRYPFISFESSEAKLQPIILFHKGKLAIRLAAMQQQEILQEWFFYFNDSPIDTRKKIPEIITALIGVKPIPKKVEAPKSTTDEETIQTKRVSEKTKKDVTSHSKSWANQLLFQTMFSPLAKEFKAEYVQENFQIDWQLALTYKGLIAFHSFRFGFSVSLDAQIGFRSQVKIYDEEQSIGHLQHLATLSPNVGFEFQWQPTKWLSLSSNLAIGYNLSFLEVKDSRPNSQIQLGSGVLISTTLASDFYFPRSNLIFAGAHLTWRSTFTKQLRQNTPGIGIHFGLNL